ncbi:MULTISPECIES: ANTAR domain-containing protein [Streptomyces]|uniref:ANTAR domain-containing protein n=1 Tax=Streptomyces TaxID=1883 RepID=UPI001153F372|nr:MULTISPECIES: ANTAR domain-containing protein [Streptomyces]TQJ36942.1 ANTAR domain-containing protein [Streptomyces sp. SLBN-115]
MTTSRDQRFLPDGDGTWGATVEHLQQENAQLRQAVDSHAVVDQAIGVLVVVHRIPPGAGFEVLREVSQHANIKLHTVAEMVIDWALGQPLPGTVERELGQAVQRTSDQGPAGHASG